MRLRNGGSLTKIDLKWTNMDNYGPKLKAWTQLDAMIWGTQGNSDVVGT